MVSETILINKILTSKNKNMKKTFYIVVAVYLVLFAIVAKAQTISTFAGSASAVGTYSGDGGAATSAGLDYPGAAVMDAAGNVYITDRDNHVVRKVNTSGIISTIAGNGTAGTSGDGGAATAAQISQPVGMTIDASGNLYVAEYGGHSIRKITPAGIISTVAGCGISGHTGDGGAATAAKLSYPTDVAVDAAGNMYISDYNFGYVRKVSPSGTITSFAGGGSSYADGIPATDAALWANNGVCVDAAGNVYIADLNNNRICKVTPSGLCYTICGDGTAGYTGDGGAATAARTNMPAFVQVDQAGNLFFSDHSNHVIRRISTSGVITTVAGNGTVGNSGDGGAATAANLSLPAGLFISPTGDLYFCAQGYGLTKKVTATAIAITGASNICAGATTTFTAATPGAVWSSSNPSVATVNPATGVVTGVSAGTATISYVMGLGFGTASITIDPCYLSVENISSNNAPLIYPNPSNGIFGIKLKEQADKTEITIYDMLGKKVLSKTEYNTSLVILNDEGVPAGQYLIKIASGEKIYREKITIIK